MSRKKSFRPFTQFFWFAVFIVLAAFAVRAIPASEVLNTLNRLKPAQVVILILMNLLVLLMFSIRWAFLLKALGRPVAIHHLIGYRLAAFGISYFTPGPQVGGEPLQVYLTHKRHELSRAEAVASVALDRLLELLANFIFLAFGLLVINSQGLFPGLSGWQTLVLALAAAGMPLIYLAALGFGKTPFGWLEKRFEPGAPPGPVLRLLGVLRSAEKQVYLFCRRKPRAVLAALVFSLLIWAVMVAEYWLLLVFLGGSFSFGEVIAALTAARLAFLLPSPGGLGTLEVSQVLVMQALGYSPAFGFSVALLIRGRDVLLGLTGLVIGAALFQTPVGSCLVRQVERYRSKQRRFL